MYISKTYEAIVDTKAIYKEKLLKIPKPLFVVLYNGAKPYPAEKTLKLSDAFMDTAGLFEEDSPLLELKVKVLNINEGHNTEKVKKCKELAGYVKLVGKARRYMQKGFNQTDAMAQAVKDCIKEGVLAEFLKKHSVEVITMFAQEFDIDIAKEVWQEEAREDGLKEGMEKGVEKTQLKSAKAMLEKNLPIDLIIEITGLPRARIEAL